MNAPGPSFTTLLVLLPLVLWRVVSRFRRMVGRQRLSRLRPRITLILFPALVLLFAWHVRGQVDQLAWLSAGLVAGSLLSVYGLRTTKFEAVAGQGFFYTPNASLGIALSLLFVARIVYRFVEVYALRPDLASSASPVADFASSSATLAAFGLLAGYYIAYMIGLVRWRQRVTKAKARRETAQRTEVPKD